MPPVSSHRVIFLLEEVYAKAKTYHNNFELNAEWFKSQLLAIIEKQSQTASGESAAIDILKRLHTDDLYLTLACAQSIDRAWERLDSLYSRYMQKQALKVCDNHQQASDLGQDTLTHLFLPDKKGKRRIASYQGLSPLTNWLAIVVQHRAIEEWKSPFNQFESLDADLDKPDESSIQRVESATRSNAYRRMANDSLRIACRVLSERDRWFLTLRYEEELKVKKLAEMANLKPQTVTHHIQHAQEKLRKEICSVLKKEYKLNEQALKECIEEIVTNPAYSLLNLMKVV
jgi:RNA polymerase sigma-70 factor, ECF subfamily